MSKCSAPLLEWSTLVERMVACELEQRWTLSADEKSISRSFVAKDWNSAMKFLNSVSAVAENLNHHPDVHLRKWREVQLVVTTHSQGGLTEMDVELAREIDEIDVDYSKKWLREQKIQEVEELPAKFDESYYKKGLNFDFLSDDKEALLEKYASQKDGKIGGGGKFENPEVRDIARSKIEILQALKDYAGLTAKSVIADVGAGTGVLEESLSKNAKKVLCSEISPGFQALLEQRIEELGISHNVNVIKGDERNPNLPPSSCDIVLLCDVYHHLLYPTTVMRQIRKSLAPFGALVIIDFHRDPERIKSHDSDWVLRHLRADQATFTREIETAGFLKIADVDLPGLPENYFLVFRQRPIPLDEPGADWANRGLQ